MFILKKFLEFVKLNTKKHISKKLKKIIQKPKKNFLTLYT